MNRRLQVIVRVAAVLKLNIEANGGVYDPMMAPNFQSIFDCATLSDEHLAFYITDEVLVDMEKGPFPAYAKGVE